MHIKTVLEKAILSLTVISLIASFFVVFTPEVTAAAEPRLGYAKQYGGSGPDWYYTEGYAITTDSDGNVYIGGYVEGTVDLDPSEDSYPVTATAGDLFVSKIDPSGNLIWAQVFNGSGYNWIYSIAVDNAGSVYTTGYFDDTTDFDPGAGVFELSALGGNRDTFISKLDSDGNFVWAGQLGGTGSDQGNALVTDSNNNVYIGGEFEGTIDADPGAGSYPLTAAGSFDNDAFIIKLDVDGNLVWAFNYGGPDDDDVIDAMAIDSSDNLLITGNYNGVVDFDFGAGTAEHTGTTYDTYVLKLDSDGNLVWVQVIDAGYVSGGSQIEVDQDDNVIIGGMFYNMTDFDPGAGVYNLDGYRTTFVLKLNSSGAFVFADAYGDYDTSVMTGMDVDSEGNIYTYGQISDTFDIDPGAGTVNVEEVDGSGYLLKLNGLGEFEWVQQISRGGGSWTNNMATDDSDNIYLLGNFYDTTDFDPTAEVYELTAMDENGIGDPFIVKLTSELPPLTWTLDEDFHNNAVVGPDMEFGTADDGDSGDNMLFDEARAGGDEVTLKPMDFSQIELGNWYSTTGIRDDGTLWTAGDNWEAQLCQGDDNIYEVMTQAGVDSDWASVSHGWGHTLLLKENGTLWGCGDNGEGQLGQGDGAPANSPVPIQIGGENDWAMVSAGESFSLAIKNDGTLWSWGADWDGALGQGTVDVDLNVPTQVGVATNWEFVVAADYHALALKTDGTLWSWGANWYGELGHGDLGDYHEPTQIGTDTDWEYVNGHIGMSAAIKTDGTLWTWGYNEGDWAGRNEGTLGVGDNVNRLEPTLVGTDTDWSMVSPGAFHMIALKTDGTIWTWGGTRFSDGGLPQSDTENFVPVQVGSDDDWVFVSGGESMSLAVKADDSVWGTGQMIPNVSDFWDIQLGFHEMIVPPYYNAGTLTGIKVYAGDGNVADWTGLSWNSEALPAGTTISFRVRTSSDDVTYSPWSVYFSQSGAGTSSGSGDLTSIPDAEYIEIEVSLTTTDTLITPTLLDFTLDYDPIGGTGGGGDGGTEPTVTTGAASMITDQEFFLSGEITDTGSSAPQERGFEFGLTNAYGELVGDTGGPYGTGTFSDVIAPLDCGTTYHYRAYATSADGTGYGSDQTLTTPDCATPPTGGNSSSGSTANPFEPIIAPILPILPVPTPVSAEEPKEEEVPPVFNCVRAPCEPAPSEEPVKQDEPVFNCIAEPCEQVEPTEEEVPLTPTQPTYPPVRGESGSGSVIGDWSDRVSGWFGGSVNQVPMDTLSSTGLVVLAALLPLAVGMSTFAAFAAGIPLGLSGLQLIYSRYFQNLLSFLGLRKKRRVWGTVYDSQTKQPLDPAVVELIDAKTGEVKERAITDLAGRFGFLATSGTFILRASKTHYAFPSKTETGSTDEIFENLYHGEKITLKEGSTLVAPNIPMDPVGFDWNQEAKQKLLPSRLRMHYLVQLLFNTVFIFGFAFAIYNVANYPSAWNYIALGLYVLILMLRWLIKPKQLWGRLTKDGQPLADVKVELLHPQFNVVMGKALSTADGKFFLKVPEPGEYKIRVSTRHGLLIQEAMVSVGKERVFNSQINF